MKPDFNMKVSFAHNQAQRRPRIGHTWVVVIQGFLHADVSALQFFFSLLEHVWEQLWLGKRGSVTHDQSNFLQWMMQPGVKFCPPPQYSVIKQNKKKHLKHPKCNFDLLLLMVFTLIILISSYCFVRTKSEHHYKSQNHYNSLIHLWYCYRMKNRQQNKASDVRR